MRRALLLVLVLGCGGGSSKTPDAAPLPDSPPEPDAEIDAAITPVFRNQVTMPDSELATRALQIMGAPISGAQQNCNDCHGLTRQNLRYWRTLSDTSMTSCFTDLAVTTQDSAKAMIECMRSMPGGDFETKKLGIFSTAVNLPWMEFTFWRAYGAAGAAELAKLKVAAGMPKVGTPMTQQQFDIVAEWYARGLPMLDQTLPADPPPSTCTPSISIEVAPHVAAMKTTGWRAENKAAMMAMHGCGAATDPKLCLSAYPFGTDQTYGTGWDLPGTGKLRVLADVTYRSSYWTRSSPDGRFIGHGVQDVAGSYVIDLQRGGMQVPINVAYDPNWFPDNSGFVFQGGPKNVCAQSVLTSNPTSVTMNEPGCANLNTIGLYEHVGRALGGGDYFAVESSFVSDDGGHSPTLRDPYASFGSQARTGFIPMIFDGMKYVAKAQVNVATPFEGDTVLSPSAKLAITRVAGPNDMQLGFVLRKVNAVMNGNSYTITAPEVARYCVGGGKPGFSYDERWIVYHHYVTAADAVSLGFTGAADPLFAPYLTQGAANIYLMDLTTGVPVRITNMAPGQYALFPHFRSDGWIYAAIRDTNLNHEYMVASDAALLAE